MNDKEVDRWSLLRALREFVQHRKLSGIEAEASDEVARQLERPSSGFYIPADVTRRSLNSTTPSAGGFSIATELGSMIEALYARSQVARLGATILSGLRGSLFLPKQTSVASTSWLAEQATSPDSSPSFGGLLLSPKRISGVTTLSQQLFRQTSGSIESWLRADFVRAIAVELDKQALVGVGGSAPLGIMNTTGVGAVTFGATPTLDKITSFEAAIANANAEGDNEQMAFVTSPDARKKLRNTEKKANTGKFLWRDDGTMVGYRAEATTNVSGDKLIFGRWSDVVLADWNAMEAVVDFYTLAQTGQIRIIATQLADVGLRHPESFCVSTDSAAQ